MPNGEGYSDPTADIAIARLTRWEQSRKSTPQVQPQQQVETAKRGHKLPPDQLDAIIQKYANMEDIREERHVNNYKRALTAHNIAARGITFKDAYEIATCCLKTHYYTEEQAGRAAEHQRKSKGFENTPYLCPICSEWHLTSKQQEDSDEAA